MALRGNNFFMHAAGGVALPPQSIASATVLGSTIVEPWSIGRQITFILLGGAFAAGAVGASAIQVRKKSDGTWTALLQKDGVTAVVFTASKIADTGSAELGYVWGTIPFADVDTEAYNAIRCNFQAANANAQLVGIAYVISDLYSEPGTQVDDLWSKVHLPVGG